MRINIYTHSCRKGTFMRYGSSCMYGTLECVCVCFCWCSLIFPYLMSHRSDLAATERCGCRSLWRVFPLFLHRWRKIAGLEGKRSMAERCSPTQTLANADAHCRCVCICIYFIIWRFAVGLNKQRAESCQTTPFQTRFLGLDLLGCPLRPPMSEGCCLGIFRVAFAEGAGVLTPDSRAERTLTRREED